MSTKTIADGYAHHLRIYAATLSAHADAVLAEAAAFERAHDAIGTDAAGDADQALARAIAMSQLHEERAAIARDSAMRAHGAWRWAYAGLDPDAVEAEIGCTVAPWLRDALGTGVS